MEFDFKKVDSEELLRETFRVRYEIYCEECAFLPAARYPDGLERDEYDDHSVHFAAFADGEVIGTVRMVRHSPLGYPLHRHCNVLYVDEAALPQDGLIEVSRLALRRSFRRRREDGLYGVESYITKREGGILPERPEEMSDLDRRRQRPVVTMGLYKAMYHESKRAGYTHWYAAMEKKLWYSLARFNFTFKEIGPEVDYYGPVTPYLGIIADLEREVSEKSPPLWAMLLDGLDKAYWPEWMHTAPEKG